jgi:hypothetical protein
MAKAECTHPIDQLKKQSELPGRERFIGYMCLACKRVMSSSQAELIKGGASGPR